MPRLPPKVLRDAFRINPLLPLILRTCRDQSSASNELRWLQEHVRSSPTPSNSKLLSQLCLDRSRGKPLQYILGNQPFGDLEILCRKGVLIPRPATEAYISRLASHILSHQSGFDTSKPLRILDLCTGTGCIALLLHSLLSHKFAKVEACGIDNSPAAIRLARKNLDYNISQGFLKANAASEVTFAQGDIFKKRAMYEGHCDIVISNPPYISPQGFDHETSRSVRNWEPKTALVPRAAHAGNAFPSAPDDVKGDVFYPQLLQITKRIHARLLVLEVADMAQAIRVARLTVTSIYPTRIEIWRDFLQGGDCVEMTVVAGEKIRVYGQGDGRAVVAWT